MTMTDEQRSAWERMNRALDEHGDSPEYRSAFAEWAATHGLVGEASSRAGDDS